jgi:hypothetical protein
MTPREVCRHLAATFPAASWDIRHGCVGTQRGAYRLTLRAGLRWFASTCIARQAGDGPLWLEGEGADPREALEHLAELVGREASDGRRSPGTREDAAAALITIRRVLG